MTNTYIVAYDLNNEGKSRPKILKIFDQFAYAMLSESSYAINTDLTLEAVFKKFESIIDKDDNLYVIPLKGPYQGWGPKEVIDWLDEALR